MYSTCSGCHIRHARSIAIATKHVVQQLQYRAPQTVEDMEVGVEVDIQVHGAGGIDRLWSLGRYLYVEHSDLLHQSSEECLFLTSLFFTRLEVIFLHL